MAENESDAGSELSGEMENFEFADSESEREEVKENIENVAIKPNLVDKVKDLVTIGNGALNWDRDVLLTRLFKNVLDIDEIKEQPVEDANQIDSKED